MLCKNRKLDKYFSIPEKVECPFFGPKRPWPVAEGAKLFAGSELRQAAPKMYRTPLVPLAGTGHTPGTHACLSAGMNTRNDSVIPANAGIQVFLHRG
jgi:hypothetical protein